MKKILAIFLCAVMMCAMFVTAHADEEIPADEEEAPTTEGSLTTEAENVTETENPVTESEPPTVEIEAPVTEAAPPVTEEDTSFDDWWAGFMSTAAAVTEPTPTVTAEVNTGESGPTVDVSASFPTTDEIIQWVQDHLEEISVIITLILTVFYQVKKHAALNKSVATLNNNSITVAENSNNAILKALAGVETVSTTFGNYKEEMTSLLSEIRQNAEEKQKLEAALAQVENYLTTAKLANVEIANEVAELLVLANIPNSKKEELYARHRAAVDAIAAAEKTEVKNDVVEDVAEEA